MTTHRKKLIPDMKKLSVHLNVQGHRRGKICKTNTRYRSTVSKFLTSLQRSNSKENLSQRRKKSTKQRTDRKLFLLEKIINSIT